METNYYHPRELEEITALLEEQEGTMLVNGGSDITLNTSIGRVIPTGIIDIHGMKSMNTITDGGQYVHIRGNATYRQIQDSPACGRVGRLVRAVGSVRGPVIRTVATPTGNIATAVSPADCASMMLVLDTELVLIGVRGERIIRQENIYLGAYKTDMQSNEIIKEMRFPSLGPDRGNGYARFSRRESQDIVEVIIDVVVAADKKGRCLSAVISLGALNTAMALAPSIGERVKDLGRGEAIQLALKLFPREVGLREGYFKRYKEKTTCNAMAEALNITLTETEKGDSCYAYDSL